MHLQESEKREHVRREEFAGLFAQLDRADAAAPIGRGLRHMTDGLELLRRSRDRS